MLYLNNQQKREVVQDIGPSALYFIEMLLGKVNTPDYVYNDKDFSKHLGLSLRVTQDLRRKVQKAGYLHIYKITKGNDVAIKYFISKESVNDFLCKEEANAAQSRQP